MSASITASRWRLPALVALWLQVIAVFCLCAFALWNGKFGLLAWLSASEAFLSALALVWWTQLFALVSARRGLPKTNGTWQALSVLYPVLTALRFSLWGLTLLAPLAGVAPEANPVALTALFTVWGGAIWARNAVNAGMLRLAAGPNEDVPANTARLAEWLNVAAALSLGMLVLNAVPIKGFSDVPTLTSQLAYGVEGIIEITATLLAFLTLRAASTSKAE